MWLWVCVGLGGGAGHGFGLHIYQCLYISEGGSGDGGRGSESLLVGAKECRVE